MLNRDRVYYLSLTKHPDDGKILGVIRYDPLITLQEQVEVLDLDTRTWVWKNNKVPHPTQPSRLVGLHIQQGGPGSGYAIGPGWVNSTITEHYLFLKADHPADVDPVNIIKSLGIMTAKEWYKYVRTYEVLLKKSIPILQEMEESEEII
jgi:hypothetical protein